MDARNHDFRTPWISQNFKYFDMVKVSFISKIKYGFFTCILRIFSILIKLQWSIFLAYVIGLFFELSCSSWISEFFFSVVWLTLFLMWHDPCFISSSSVRGIHSYSSFLQLLPRTVLSSAAHGISSSAAKPSDMIDSSLESDELESNFLINTVLFTRDTKCFDFKLLPVENQIRQTINLLEDFLFDQVNRASFVRFYFANGLSFYFFILSSSKK